MAQQGLIMVEGRLMRIRPTPEGGYHLTPISPSELKSQTELRARNGTDKLQAPSEEFGVSSCALSADWYHLNRCRAGKISVPLSERRHRLYEHEIPEVARGLKLRLEQLLETEEDQANAEIAFRTLYRLVRGVPGRPKYPEFDWRFVDYFIHANPELTSLTSSSSG